MESIVVKVTTDTGHIGHGEAPATAVITGDTLPSIAWAIEGVIAPQLIGRSIEEFEDIMHLIQTAMVHNSSAKAALDMAIYDLFAQACERPLWKLLGGYRNVLKTDLTISLNTTEQMIEDSLRAAAEGYDTLKIKVGRNGAEDIERICQIYAALPPNIRLRIDANQGWTPKIAVRVIRALEDRGVEMDFVEQPVPAEDITGLQFVTEHVLTPILADESVFSVCDAVNIIQRHAADIINIKLMKTGGIYQAQTICNLAETYGVQCMIGCMLEGGIAATAAAQFAGAKRNIHFVDLDGPSLGVRNPVRGGATFNGAHICLTDASGLGIQEIDDLHRFLIQG